MSWFKIDDNFPRHPKVVRAGTDAAWLFVAGGCYCAQYLTNGFIPKDALSGLTALKQPAKLAERLIDAGLWHDCLGEYEVHDYLKYNPSREQVEEERRKALERRSKGGQRSGERRATNINPDPTPPGLLTEDSGDSGANAAPDVRVQELVGGYVDDYRAERAGKDPPRSWTASAGKAIKRALADGEAATHVAACLGVIAHESKNPSTLPYVLADFHAGRERRVK